MLRWGGTVAVARRIAIAGDTANRDADFDIDAHNADVMWPWAECSLRFSIMMDRWGSSATLNVDDAPR